MENTKILSKQDIIEVDDLPKELIEVKEWGGSVYVRGLTSGERSVFEKEASSKEGIDVATLRERLCAMAMINENGESLFSLKETKVLSKKSAVALQRIFIAAQKLAGIGEEMVKEAVEDFPEDQS